eukprot:COSAG05_NODE_5469_length_1166_cov_1.027179_1_plen_210_part_00
MPVMVCGGAPPHACADWVVAVPLGIYLIRGWMADSCQQLMNPHPTEEGDPTHWDCDAGAFSFLAQSPLAVAWWCNCLGVLCTCLIMVAAIAVSDWEQLSQDAQDELLEEEEQRDPSVSASSSRRSGTSRSKSAESSAVDEMLLSSSKLLGRTFSWKEKDVLSQGERWIGSVAEEGSGEEEDAEVTDRTWPRRGPENRAQPQQAGRLTSF